ncbi:MAG: hypothetical protein ABSF64_04530 [Bryobacteraceae bacterium]
MEVIRRVARPVTSAGLKSAAGLNKPEVLPQIVQQVQQIVAPSQGELEGMGSEEQVRARLQKAAEMWVEKSMDIPRIVIQPIGDTAFGYDDFDLDVAHIAFQPVSRDILLAYLRTDERELLNADVAFKKEKRLEDYLVRNLWDYNDISYDDQADLLHKLAGQMVAHLRTLHRDEDTLLNVVRYHERKLAELIHAQMQSHVWTKETGFEVTVTLGVTTLRENNYTRPAGEAPVNPRARGREAVHPQHPVRRLPQMPVSGAEIRLRPGPPLRRDPRKRRGSREMVQARQDPVPNLLPPRTPGISIRTRFRRGSQDRKTAVPTEARHRDDGPSSPRQGPRRDQMVQARHRTRPSHGGKPWSYLLIPHDVITASATLDGPIATFRTATA